MNQPQHDFSSRESSSISESSHSMGEGSLSLMTSALSYECVPVRPSFIHTSFLLFFSCCCCIDRDVDWLGNSWWRSAFIEVSFHSHAYVLGFVFLSASRISWRRHVMALWCPRLLLIFPIDYIFQTATQRSWSSCSLENILDSWRGRWHEYTKRAIICKNWKESFFLSLN